jgi:hypothetical protein
MHPLSHRKWHSSGQLCEPIAHQSVCTSFIGQYHHARIVSQSAMYIPLSVLHLNSSCCATLHHRNWYYEHNNAHCYQINKSPCAISISIIRAIGACLDCTYDDEGDGDRIGFSGSVLAKTERMCHSCGGSGAYTAMPMTTIDQCRHWSAVSTCAAGIIHTLLYNDLVRTRCQQLSIECDQHDQSCCTGRCLVLHRECSVGMRNDASGRAATIARAIAPNTVARKHRYYRVAR